MIRRPPRSTLFPLHDALPISLTRIFRLFSRPTRMGSSGPKRSRITSALARSEEHTSELQSQSNLVCRLLLEKKKKTPNLLTQAVNARTYIPHPTRYINSTDEL